MFNLIKHLTENRISHTVSDSGQITVGGDIYPEGTRITELPDNLTVGGSLHLYGTPITALSDNLNVGGYLTPSGEPVLNYVSLPPY